MDNFDEKIKSLSVRISKVKDNVATEEATKTSIIMPFIQALGYDIFNPEEFVPEFTADVGIKKGEKVDYAIMKDGAPVILIEAKSVNEKLEKHDSQLFRYFGVTKAKFAILTNGITYRFYSDLDEQNKMDSVPFFELNILEFKDHQISELSKFRRENFDIDNILNAASELKYTKEIVQFFQAQWENPSDELISLILSEIYPSKKTKQVIDKFKPLIKRSMKQFINDAINDKLKAALANTKEEESKTPAIFEGQQEVAACEEKVEQKPVTTEEEIEGYVTVKFLLKDTVDSSRVYYRDNLSYFNVLLDDNIRKWICRLHLNGSNKFIQFNDEQKTMVPITSVMDISEHKEKLIEVTNKFVA
ncbi:type I restriction endonuclease [Brevibacillus sp. AF8]|uniref:type I restriction endonuclease n=1 Tax=Brevibacillus sp. AF8 TaxID=2825881 RepID=UPI001E43CC22|nr:type I restriction endonuclease [Brevibacillus sp. AF8]MCE0450055.1 type I restriction enzyme HsdR N-terminal domain-containing protein [Brevibacillus sp. AF8]